MTGYLGDDKFKAVLFLTLTVGLTGLAVSGFNINHIDTVPRFAGVLMGITNTVATIPGFVGPQLAKALTPNVSPASNHFLLAVSQRNVSPFLSFRVFYAATSVHAHRNRTHTVVWEIFNLKIFCRLIFRMVLFSSLRLPNKNWYTCTCRSNFYIRMQI